MPLARRTFLGVSLAASAGLVASRALADDKFGLTRNWEGKPPIVMPDPAWEIHDPAFKGRLGNAFVERLWSGGLWTEGPVWMALPAVQRHPQCPGDALERRRRPRQCL